MLKMLKINALDNLLYSWIIYSIKKSKKEFREKHCNFY